MPDENSYNKNLSSKSLEKDEIIHISSQLSSKLIVELMDEYPNLKKITCPPSIYKRISKKYLEVLKELGIIVEIKHNWGNRKKYSDEKKKEILELLKQGKTPLQIAEKVNLPLKTIYYIKNSFKDESLKLKVGKKSKYSDSIWTNVKNLAKSGISPQKISKRENIPLRTIYYMIKKY
ncbi:hypothetical protein ALNOE001_02540 [Candidatus Methanobinarius endosymbioticus]|uniref:Resolvase HTH domain-containing protein n=1 Tax=Candidatus Methanobinarius endosymbioticus TaxID=2006182 RepID=A0A366MFU3_9EURY|nr:hypothetical protein ALNOE001_02540 [Candidatus Methanobinarius endosymbioticus]